MAVLTHRLRRQGAGFLLALGLLGGDVSAQRPHVGEQALKAAFLYNFTRFIEWPTSAFAGSSESFDVCVLAGPAFSREVEAVFAGEQVAGRAVRVVFPAPLEDLKSCHLLYIAREQGQAAQHLSDLAQMPLLTVGEGRRFLEQGGVIAFQVENDRVRFDVNRRRAEGTGLIISSKLLRVARELWPE